MSNFPKKWLEFNKHKELRRLRNDLKDTFELKIQIASSVIFEVISLFLDKNN